MNNGGNERQYAKFALRIETLGLDVAVGAARKTGSAVPLLPRQSDSLRAGERIENGSTSASEKNGQTSFSAIHSHQAILSAHYLQKMSLIRRSGG